MGVATFKEWFLKDQRTEGECNCNLPEYFNHLINSKEIEDINDLKKLKDRYNEYADNIRFQFCN